MQGNVHPVVRPYKTVDIHSGHICPPCCTAVQHGRHIFRWLRCECFVRASSYHMASLHPMKNVSFLHHHPVWRCYTVSTIPPNFFTRNCLTHPETMTLFSPLHGPQAILPWNQYIVNIWYNQVPLPLNFSVYLTSCSGFIFKVLPTQDLDAATCHVLLIQAHCYSS